MTLDPLPTTASYLLQFPVTVRKQIVFRVDMHRERNCFGGKEESGRERESLNLGMWVVRAQVPQITRWIQCRFLFDCWLWKHAQFVISTEDGFRAVKVRAFYSFFCFPSPILSWKWWTYVHFLSAVLWFWSSFTLNQEEREGRERGGVLGQVPSWIKEILRYIFLQIVC